MNTQIIAEIGQNHQGDIEIARQMIHMAHECGADGVKFQKREPRSCLSKARYEAPYQSEHSFGRTYGEHREKLELSLEKHAQLRDLATSLGMTYSSSVWDIPSLKDIVSLKPASIKVPSAHNEDGPLLRAIPAVWEGDIHASNGMMTREAESRMFEMLQGARSTAKVVLYACTAVYPARMNEVCLKDIPRLLDDYPCLAAGLSGHHLGTALDLAAVALGATFIERHVTLDRTMKGRDHAASLEPGQLMRLVRDVRAVESAWQERRGILPTEEKELHRKVIRP